MKIHSTHNEITTMHFYFQSRYLLSLSFALICSNIYIKLKPLSIKIFQPNHLKLSTLEL